MAQISLLEIPQPESEIVIQTPALNSAEEVLHGDALLKAQRFLHSEAELVEVISRVDRSRLFEKFGLTSCFSYCTRLLGLSEETAYNFIRVARKSLEVPALKEALKKGDITVSKARKIASVLTKENQDEWLQKARSSSKNELEKAVAARQPEVHDYEKATFISEDKVRLEIVFSEEQMQLLRRAQDLVSQSKGKFVSLEETIEVVIDFFLDRHDPVRRAQRRLRKKSSTPKDKTLEVNSLAQSEKPNQSRDHSRESTPQRGAIPAVVLHQVHLRDQGRCQAHGPDGSVCGEKRWIQLHHLKPVSRGGQHVPENLITLCAQHHRMFHRFATALIQERN